MLQITSVKLSKAECKYIHNKHLQYLFGGHSDYAPVWRVLFDACEFDADQLGASHYDAMLVWRATVWRVSQFDAWQFGAFCQFAALFIFHVFLTSSHIRHCTRR